MKRFGWPRPAMLIGFVLAPQAETFFYQALQFNGWGFLIRPGVLIIAALTLASIYFGLKNRVDDTGPTSEAVVTSHSSRNIQIAFAVAMMVFFGVALWDSAGHSFLGAVFPLGVGVVGAVFGVILLVHLWRGHQDHPAFFDYEIVGDHVGTEGNGWFWTGPAWIAGLVAATALVGFYIAMIGFFLAVPASARRCDLDEDVGDDGGGGGASSSASPTCSASTSRRACCRAPSTCPGRSGDRHEADRDPVPLPARRHVARALLQPRGLARGPRDAGRGADLGPRRRPSAQHRRHRRRRRGHHKGGDAQPRPSTRRPTSTTSSPRWR